MDTSNNIHPKWYEELLLKIRDEPDDIQKAHLMRQLNFNLISELKKFSKTNDTSGSDTQNISVISKETLSKHFEEYLNFVDSSEAVSAEQQPDDIPIDQNKWKCTLTDPQKYLKHINENKNEHQMTIKQSKLFVNNKAEGASNASSNDEVERRSQVAAIDDGELHEIYDHYEMALENNVVDRSGKALTINTPAKSATKANSSKFTFQQSSSNSKLPKSNWQSPLNATNGDNNSYASTLPNFHKPHENNNKMKNFSIFQSAQPSNNTRTGHTPTNIASNKRKTFDESVYGEPPLNKYSNTLRSGSGISGLKSEQQHQQPQNIPTALPAFRTGSEELQIRYDKKYGNYSAVNGYGNQPAQQDQQHPLMAYGSSKRTLGWRYNGEGVRGVTAKFVPPYSAIPAVSAHQNASPSGNTPGSEENFDFIQCPEKVSEEDARLKHIDPKMIELIRSEIMDKHTSVDWDDIAGLDYAKTIIKEAVVWPILRPDIFTGLRRPPRGMLLFGPPGTGKTMIGKCIASQSNSTFFSISASSLTSKWIGDGEKMVRALFAVAATHQPAVVFIDEIDSLLCQRSESEHESSRRLKTEFLVQLDGASTGDDERILIVGATNRPQELDEAARRRLVKRLYIPLPELEARVQILDNLLKRERTSITMDELKCVSGLTAGFSGADMKTLCHEASMGPIRSISATQMNLVDVNDVRPLNYSDFEVALKRVRASVSQNDLKQYIEWDRTYGSGE